MKQKRTLKNIVIILLITLIYFLSKVNILLPKKEDFYEKEIKKVEIRGNKNTDTKDILGLIEIREGKKLTKKIIDSDLKNLFSSGYFYNIDIKADFIEGGVKVIIDLDEKPRIQDIEFIGTDNVFPSKIREKIPVKQKDVLSQEKINLSKEIILDLYKDEGFFLAYVKAELSKINKNSNTVTLRFLVDEGDEIPVGKINIFGNEKLDTTGLLKKLELNEEGILEGGEFKEEDFEKDKQLIINFMKSKGFLDGELDPEGTGWEIHWKDPEKKDKRVVVVNFKINEGDLYYYNGYDTDHDYTLDSEGNPYFLNKELNPKGTKLTDLRPVYPINQIQKVYEFSSNDIGKVFDETKYLRDRSLINELYSTKGYLFAQVVPHRTIIELTDENLKSYEGCLDDPDKAIKEECEKNYKRFNIKKLREIYNFTPESKNRKFVHTNLTIRENNLAYIESIIIKGNKKTQTKVIRREILVKEGELFNSYLVGRSREKIFNLGYFKEVNLDMRPGSDDSKMNLIIEVTEQPTGSLSMGGGYGTLSGFSIFSELGENNLNGTGQQISGRVEYGPQQQALSITWTEPWLFNFRWSLSLTAFYAKRKIIVGAVTIVDESFGANVIKESATYERDSLGVSAQISHRFWTNWTHYHRYSPSIARSSNPSSLVSDQILNEVDRNWQFRSQLTNGIIRDTRDNVFSPTKGFSALYQIDNVGQYLGGNTHFDQHKFIFDFYHSWFNYSFFGLFRGSRLRKWKVVQQFRSSNTFVFERVPAPGHNQDKLRSPYLQASDLLYLGGYESLRGWTYQDPKFPLEWQDGANHRLLFTSELRFPIEPNLLWLVVFLDAGAMYEDLNKSVGQKKAVIDAYDQRVNNLRYGDPFNTYLFENYNLSYLEKRYYSPYELNRPSNQVLTTNNVAMDKFRFSWGIGIRIQIPVLPLRLYFAQKLRYTGIEDRPLGIYQNDKAFTFVFGIGDYRF